MIELFYHFLFILGRPVRKIIYDITIPVCLIIQNCRLQVIMKSVLIIKCAGNGALARLADKINTIF